MRRQIGRNKFVDMRELSVNECAVKGTWIGWTRGKLGQQALVEAEDGTIWQMPKSGTIEYLLRDFATEGKKYEFIYKGLEDVKKGQWAGSQAHQWDIFEYTNDDDEKKAEETTSDLDEFEGM